MALFSGRTEAQKKSEEAAKTEERKSEDKIAEEITDLSASERPRNVSRAKTEAEEVISTATIADIRGAALIGRGRCPECGGRTESLLYTAVCTSCGWLRQFAPEGGHCILYLETGDTLTCDRTYTVKRDQLLCVKDDVVVSQIDRSTVRRIDFVWGEKELARARERLRKERRGVCSWCEKDLDDVEEDDAPFEEFVAFGVFQERYVFCKTACLRSFRKQYPVRIHRNCYETDCSSCDECMKRFDTHGFKRVRVDQTG